MELAQKYRETCKANGLDANPKYLKRFEYMTKVVVLAKKAATQQQTAEDGGGQSLDQLYESIIEQSKLAETHPTIENKEQYQKDLENFMEAYKKASKEEQKTWKKAFEESEKEHTRITASLDTAKATRARVNRFPTAQVFYVVKGEDADGRKWGRIDHVGQNYTLNKPKSTPSPLPLIVCYYRYENKKYILEEKTNSFKSNFDKQLLDAFRTEAKVSYEQHKRFDVRNRDYEYNVKKGAIGASKPWTVFIYQPENPVYTPKTIEVPDWDDFGFDQLFYTYIDDCGAHLLTKTAALGLIDEMKEALEKQAQHIKELEDFHVNENDGDKDSEILIEVWKTKRSALETKMNAELPDPGSCIEKLKSPEPCVKFEEKYKEYDIKCTNRVLTESEANKLKAEMQDCINNSKIQLEKYDKDIKKLEELLAKSPDPDLEKDVKKYRKEYNALLIKTEDEILTLTSLVYDEKVCLEPIPLDIYFMDNSNKITGDKNEKQLTEITKLLVDNPHLNICLTANTCAPITESLDKENPYLKEDTETDYIMPDDFKKFDPSVSEKEREKILQKLSKEKKEKIVDKDKMSDEDKKMTTIDIMMIRGEVVKKLFIDKGVPASQIIVKPGKNLGGKNEKERSINRKVQLEFI